jgi:hypothetical protein
MVADSLIGIGVVVVAVAVLIYLWPKIFTKAPEAARAIGKAQGYLELGKLEAQQEIQKMKADLKSSATASSVPAATADSK